MARSIRVSSGVIPIEVNDNGDTIELRTDAEFMKACLRMQQGFIKLKDEYDAVVSDEAASAEAQAEAVDKMFASTDAAINDLFGEDACDKIFPGTRSVMQYAEFFEQLLVIMQESQEASASKYTKK